MAWVSCLFLVPSLLRGRKRQRERARAIRFSLSVWWEEKRGSEKEGELGRFALLSLSPYGGRLTDTEAERGLESHTPLFLLMVRRRKGQRWREGYGDLLTSLSLQ